MLKFASTDSPPLSGFLFSGLWDESPENGNFSMIGQRMSANFGRWRLDFGLFRDSTCWKSPLLAGLSYTKERNSPISGLAGWRYSANSTSLCVNSLQTGNFTRKICNHWFWQAKIPSKTTAPQVLLEQSLTEL